MESFLREIDEEGLQTLTRQDQQREKHRKGGNANRDMMAALRREPAAGSFRFASQLWILQRCMPSHLGPLAPERSEVFLEHAKHLGLLAETYALTETGHILNELLPAESVALIDGRATPNPLFVGARLAVRGLYTWALLESDALLPFLVREFVSRKQNDPNLLASAVDALIARFERGARIDSARELKSLRSYRERVSKGASNVSRAKPVRGNGLRAFMDRAAAVQPGFKIHRHHVRPRLEHLVDLGLLQRRADAHGAGTVYIADDATRRAVAEWADLLEDPGRPGVPRVREHPGRTVALAACLLALEDGRVCEIEKMFSFVFDSAGTPLGQHFVFSGGSRFDGEFLIRVKPELMTALQTQSADASRRAEDK